tara:strand:- start:81 stop:455 length:375 start_codon:yes stop_codon:yes gene_type:complete
MKRIFLFIALISINLQADKDRYIALECVAEGEKSLGPKFMFILDKILSSYTAYVKSVGPEQPVFGGDFTKTYDFYLLTGVNSTVISINRNTLRITTTANNDTLDCINIDVPEDYLEYAKNKKRI